MNWLYEILDFFYPMQEVKFAMIKPFICKNLNHGRMMVSIQYCPDCGEKFKVQADRHCSDFNHAERRKSRDSFCCDCGIRLSPVRKI